jgi:Fic family protein
MAARSGHYVRQATGYRAFIPDPLPIDPPLVFDNEFLAILSRADRALGRLDGSVQSLPNPDLFVFMYVRKEATLSSQIEGTQASLGDVLEAEAQIFDPQRPSDVAEVLNYVDALNHGLARLESLPVSLRLVRELHERLMRNVRGQHLTPGEFRKTQNWIGAAGATISDAVFVPPPPEELPRLLGNLELYLHRKDDLPLLAKIGIAHAQFETIHPFLDGNGRVGRLLITFLLCERKVLIKPVLYLSHYLKQHRSEYYRLLQAIRDEGAWLDWLKFFVAGVASVSDAATETARRIVALREDHRNRLVAELGRGAGNGLTLLESLYQRPIFSVSDVAKRLSITVPAANTLTDRLSKLGIVCEITGNRRNRRFRYEPYIAVFAE